jgi:hypothetical protein
VKETSNRGPRVQVAAWCWFCLLIFGIASSSAQEFGRSSSESLRADVLKRISDAKTGVDATSLSAYEGVIDRDLYRVGPGDKLILQIWRVVRIVRLHRAPCVKHGYPLAYYHTVPVTAKNGLNTLSPSK